MSEHLNAAHALLSVSGSAIWLNCTRSIRLAEPFPDTSTEAAEEGTLAHSLCEILIRDQLGRIEKSFFKARLAEIKKDPLYNGAMLEYCTDFMVYVMGIYNSHIERNEEVSIHIETKVDLSKYIPEGFGTGDIAIITKNKIHGIDFKYGKGYEVDVVENPQLKIYGVGFLMSPLVKKGQKIETVETTIYQPRLKNIASYSYAAADLIEFARSVVAPKAKLAFEGLGEFNPGSHCKFCKAKPACKAYAEFMLEIESYQYTGPDFLSLEDIGKILLKLPDLKSWISSIDEFAMDQALNKRIPIPGFKIVRGRSNRKFIDSDLVPMQISLLLPEGKMYQPLKLRSLTDLEKEIGPKKFESELSYLIEKPAGAPTLVPETDERPALGSAAEDFKNL